MHWRDIDLHPPTKDDLDDDGQKFSFPRKLNSEDRVLQLVSFVLARYSVYGTTDQSDLCAWTESILNEMPEAAEGRFRGWSPKVGD